MEVQQIVHVGAIRSSIRAILFLAFSSICFSSLQCAHVAACHKAVAAAAPLLMPLLLLLLRTLVVHLLRVFQTSGHVTRLSTLQIVWTETANTQSSCSTQQAFVQLLKSSSQAYSHSCCLCTHSAAAHVHQKHHSP
jgi:hypothetical protein